MRLRPVATVSIALAMAASGCMGLDAVPTSPAPATLEPAPTLPPVAVPAPSGNPCEVPLRQLGQSSQLMADKLATLRAPLLAARYDGWTILGSARSVNATLGLYAQSIPALEACVDAQALTERIERVSISARRHIAVVLAAGVAVASAPRHSMVALFELLPEVVSISEDAKAIADRYSLTIAVASLPEGAGYPLGPLAPLPTPTSPPRPPRALAITGSFFGSAVSVKQYTVSGATPTEISRSMNNRGPYSEWTGGRADGQTKARVDYRFTFSTNTSGSCYIQPTDDPAIAIRYTITLPSWSPSSGTSTATVEWWNDLLLQIAIHEKRHVTIYRAAAKDLNATLASSSCGNVEAKLTAVWDRTNREQCEFDMKEYGYAIGLSLDECLDK